MGATKPYRKPETSVSTGTVRTQVSWPIGGQGLWITQLEVKNSDARNSGVTGVPVIKFLQLLNVSFEKEISKERS